MDLAADMSVSKQYWGEDWHKVFPVCDMVDLEPKLIDELYKRVVADLDIGLDWTEMRNANAQTHSW